MNLSQRAFQTARSAAVHLLYVRVVLGEAFLFGASVMARAGREVAGIPTVKTTRALVEGERVIGVSLPIPPFCRGLKVSNDTAFEIRKIVQVLPGGKDVEIDLPLVNSYPSGCHVKVLV